MHQEECVSKWSQPTERYVLSHIEEDLKYQNNQSADEKLTQEYPDDESEELTTTL
jgi:hypothetical protein